MSNMFDVLTGFVDIFGLKINFFDDFSDFLEFIISQRTTPATKSVTAVVARDGKCVTHDVNVDDDNDVQRRFAVPNKLKSNNASD